MLLRDLKFSTNQVRAKKALAHLIMSRSNVGLSGSHETWPIDCLNGISEADILCIKHCGEVTTAAILEALRDAGIRIVGETCSTPSVSKANSVTVKQCVADALRKVTVKLLAAVDEKYINRSSIDADTLAETLLAVADELDRE